MCSRSIRVISLLALSLWLLGASIACDRGAPATPPSLPHQEDAQADLSPHDAGERAREGASPSEVLVSGPGVRVTVEDFERDARRAMLFAPDAILARGEKRVPAARLERPGTQIDVLRKLTEDALIRREAPRYDVTVTEEEIEALIREDERLRRFGPQAAERGHALQGVTLKSLELTERDLRASAQAMLLREKLTSALNAAITPEEVERAWRHAHDRVRLLPVRISNTPSSREIDLFLSEERGQHAVSDHYAERSSTYRTPAIAIVDLLRAPGQGDPAQLAEAAAALAENKTSPEALAARYGLELQRAAELVVKEDPRVHAAGVGQVGVSIDAPRGDYAWIVRELIASRQSELDRPLRREIASSLMRDRDQVASAHRLAERAIDVLQRQGSAIRAEALDPKQLDALKRELGELGDRARQVMALDPVDLFAEPNGFVHGVGTSPRLAEAIFATTSPGEVIRPAVPVDQALWTGLVLARQRPDMQDFKANYPRYRAEYLEAMREAILGVRVAEWSQRDQIKISLEPLAQRFSTKTDR